MKENICLQNKSHCNRIMWDNGKVWIYTSLMLSCAFLDPPKELCNPYIRDSLHMGTI